MDTRPDMAQENYRDDEISLFDIYDFLRDGWFILVGASALGLVVGIIVSFAMPAKYQASALIDSGQVSTIMFDQTTGKRTGDVAAVSMRELESKPIESLAVLAEKMKAPGYYADQTLVDCGLAAESNTRLVLVKELAPNVARNSNFVSVSYEADSVDAAKACINSVLADVIKNQQPDITAAVNSLKAEISNAQAQAKQALESIETLQTDRDKSLALVEQQLIVARQQLASLEQSDSGKDPAAGVITVLQVLNQRGEVQKLESALIKLQSNLSVITASHVERANQLTNRLTELQRAIEPPSTRQAQFAAPVFASDGEVSPRRNLIVVISLLIGGFLGLMLLITRRAVQAIRAHEAERRAKALTAQ